MNRAALLLPLALLACAEESAPDTQAEAIRGGAKVDVCHVTGSGAIHTLNVSTSAVSAHLAHGDFLPLTFFADVDGDGYGDPIAPVEACEAPTGTVDNADDCDDTDALTSPAEEEVCGDELDNDCDGDIDEDCTVEVEIHVAGDNALWVWVDGEIVALDDVALSWAEARHATLELQTGADHAFAFYVEDWGGLAYFAASIRVDGAVVATTGDGDFTVWGATTPRGNEWSTRIPVWADQPDDASDTPNLLASPAGAWGDWMLPGYNDATWGLDTNTCAQPSYWNTAHFATHYTGFGDLHADGADFVWPPYRGAGACYSAYGVWTATAWRTELAL